MVTTSIGNIQKIIKYLYRPRPEVMPSNQTQEQLISPGKPKVMQRVRVIIKETKTLTRITIANIALKCSIKKHQLLKKDHKLEFIHHKIMLGKCIKVTIITMLKIWRSKRTAFLIKTSMTSKKILKGNQAIRLQLTRKNYQHQVINRATINSLSQNKKWKYQSKQEF